MRLAAARSLRWCRRVGEYLPQFAGLLNDQCQAVALVSLEIIRGVGERATPHVAEVAKLLEAKKKWKVRRAAIQVLKGLGRVAAPYAGIIANQIQDKDVHVKRAAVRILGELGEAGIKHIEDVNTGITPTTNR